MRWTEIKQTLRNYDWDKEIFKNEFEFLDYGEEMVATILTNNDHQTYDLVALGKKDLEENVYVDPEYSADEEDALINAILAVYSF